MTHALFSLRHGPTSVISFGLGALLIVGSACEQPQAKKSTQQADRHVEETKAAIEGSGKNDDSCQCRRPESFAPAVERVRPAVVNLYSAEEKGAEDGGESGLDPFVPRKRLVQSLGSGVIIDDQGHVVTNHHVIEGADDIRARLLDERWFETRLVGSDPKTDVALLKLVEAKDVPVAPVDGSGELAVGDWVVAIGNPLGLTSTVTAGIASGIGRSNLPLSEEMRYQDFIQTDASINPGNSGGPLVDGEGNVVGINTAISAEAQGIGFAIPVSMVQRIVGELKKSGEIQRSWLGLYVDAVPRALRDQIGLAEEGGVLVTDVVEDGPAGDAGLRKGDVIVKLGDEQVEDVDHISFIAGHLQIDEAVDCVIQRGSKKKTLKLTPSAPPEESSE